MVFRYPSHCIVGCTASLFRLTPHQYHRSVICVYMSSEDSWTRNDSLKEPKGIQFWFLQSLYVIEETPPNETQRANFYLFEQLLQLGDNGITNLNGGSLAANVTRANTSLNDVLNGLLDDSGLIEHAEGVLHHHGDGENSSDGVDNALAGNIRGGAWQELAMF